MSDPSILPDGRYYTTMEHLLARYDAVSRQLGYRATDLHEHNTWQAELRTRLRRLTGIDTMHDCALEPKVTERVEMDGYVRERVLIQTEPGVIMPVYVFLPGDLAPGQPRPTVIAPHGHSSGGKFAPAGRIMSFDEETVYAFARKPQFWSQAPTIEYQLYKADK